jgi:CheY-like chemotaxis protein
MCAASKTVWVVDDEPDVLTYLTTALEDQGFTVRSFPGVDTFLDEALASPPDLVCLDIMMPNRSGLSLYRELRSSEALRRIPIVIVSGYSRHEEFMKEEFHRLLGSEDVPEPDGFIEKPVSLPDLIGVVSGLVSEAGG